MIKTTYSAVVETGSSDPTYTRWEERVNCGHAHKTIEAAQKCLAHHQRSYCNHGHVAGTLCKRCLGRAQAYSTSGLWYNGRIHNQDGERVRG
jgi:hypothetical protein